MENTLYIGLSRQMVLRREMSVVANNIANMNTAGYRSNQMLFLEHVMEPERPGARDGHAMSMVIDQGVVRDTRPGPLTRTGNPLDIALRGEGYMVVDTPAGPRYFRGGHLEIDAERRLVDGNGLPVQGAGGGPILIPQTATEITISGTGEISIVQGDDRTETVPIGSLRLVAFDEEQRLTTLGGGLYVTNEMPRDAEETEVIQGTIEASNVQPIVEMTNMIEVARQYQSTQRLIQDEHERVRTAIRRLGRMQG